MRKVEIQFFIFKEECDNNVENSKSAFFIDNYLNFSLVDWFFGKLCRNLNHWFVNNHQQHSQRFLEVIYDRKTSLFLMDKTLNKATLSPAHFEQTIFKIHGGKTYPYNIVVQKIHTIFIY